VPAKFLGVIDALSTQREALRKREAKLIADLRDILGGLGYRLEPVGADGVPPTSGTAPARRRTVSPGPAARTCPECGRTFALPLHLGRHMSVMHKGAKAPVASGERTNPTANDATAEKRRRHRGMSPAARRAAAKRMRAYWRKRKAAGAPRRARTGAA
jgi:hypothetical protein